MLVQNVTSNLKFSLKVTRLLKIAELVWSLPWLRYLYFYDSKIKRLELFHINIERNCVSEEKLRPMLSKPKPEKRI